MTLSEKVLAQFPAKAEFLFKPAPYKVMYGGRGGSKTWDFCRALLILGAKRKLFILCARELQRSIKESVHKLLSDQIETLNLGHVYQILQHTIVNSVTGTEFVFAGIRSNISAIKSMEAIDICAVFEANPVSHNSWEVLLPTIRRDPPYGPFGNGSEIWIEFNPELESDETYKRWVLNPPAGTVVVNVNFRDNPWFPEILRRQKDEMQKQDYDAYLTVWEGKTRQTLQGAIYAKELVAAVLEERISPHIKVDRARPVDVVFDLGKSDMCCLWFMQQIGMEHHAIDYYGNCGFGFDHYIEEIQNRRYIIGRLLLPHDARQEHQAAAKTIERQARDAYPQPGQVKIVPNISITNRINALRLLFPRMYFNEVACTDGLMALRHYQYEIDPETHERSIKPMHNWASHPSDSLSYYAVEVRDGNKQMIVPQEIEAPRRYAHAQGWMG